MKLNRLWRTPPRLSWSDIVLTALPLILWFIAVHSRSALITPHCALAPERCTIAALLPMDRPAVGLEAPSADSLSFTTQGLSGVLAMSIPPLFNVGLAITRQISPAAALIATGTDLVILIQTTMWNGLFTETAHLALQRPRPFVYSDPQRAKDFSNYTSFYSGHTSFAAAATLFLFFTLAARGASRWLLALAGVTAYSLISLTGLYRVLAGRHFPSDALAGALAGILVATIIAWRHRKSV